MAAMLGCSLATGVDVPPGQEGARALAARQAAFGANRFKEVPVQPFWRLLLDNLSDPTLILLMCAAAVRRPRSEQADSDGCPATVLLDGSHISGVTIFWADRCRECWWPVGLDLRDPTRVLLTCARYGTHT